MLLNHQSIIPPRAVNHNAIEKWIPQTQRDMQCRYNSTVWPLFGIVAIESSQMSTDCTYPPTRTPRTRAAWLLVRYLKRVGCAEMREDPSGRRVARSERRRRPQKLGATPQEHGHLGLVALQQLLVLVLARAPLVLDG